MMHHKSKAIDDGQSEVFINFTKAFDHANHNVMSANYGFWSAEYHYLMDMHISESDM